jgi:putative transposase
VAVIAEALSLSESRVYFVVRNLSIETQTEEKEMNEKHKMVLEKIKHIVKVHLYYGYRKVYAILKYREGISVNRNRVYEIMKQHKLLMPVSTSNKQLFKGVKIAQNLEASRSNELWGIDMTHIWCGNDGWGYFHGVIDHFDKTCIGYNFSTSCKAMGGVMAISEAASNRTVESLELRSDNGCHYGAKIFRDELRRLGVNHTRTMVNTPKGNAVIERFFRSLKQECAWLYNFENFEQAKPIVEAWVQQYNSQRPHQSLKYMTPDQFFREKTVRKIA